MNNHAVLTNIITYDAIPYNKESNFRFPALNCQIQRSNLTCLVGPHRAQLRAYLLMLAGVSKPKQGKVEILGQDVSGLDFLAWQKLRCQIGYLSGTSPVLSTQSGLMNVMLPVLYHANLPLYEATEKARVLLAELDCDFEFTTFPALLSSFQRTQLGLARALILDPQILVLDVPLYDLGAKEREKMSMLLGKHTENRTVCMVGGLQHPHFLKQHAKQIIFISERKIMKFNGWNSFVQSEDPDVQELLSVL
jgi:ABC-type lipoprotein export system ATPase subunit